MLKYNLTFALLLWWGAIDSGAHPDYIRACAADVIAEYQAICAELGIQLFDSGGWDS